MFSCGGPGWRGVAVYQCGCSNEPTDRQTTNSPNRSPAQLPQVPASGLQLAQQSEVIEQQAAHIQALEDQLQRMAMTLLRVGGRAI